MHVKDVKVQKVKKSAKSKNNKKTNKQTIKKNKKQTKKKTSERCQNFTGEEKKRQYYHEGNENLSNDQKQKLIEYRRKYYLAHKK